MKTKSLDRYNSFGLRKEWIKILFEEPEGFWRNERMGSKMFCSFRHWGQDVGLLTDKNAFVPDFDKLAALGFDNLKLWGIFWTNAAYSSPLISFFARRVDFYSPVDTETLIAMFGSSLKERTKRNALTSLKNLFRTSPFGNELGQGICELKGNTVVSITRTAWQNPDPLVILYSLYQFAAHAEVYSFTLTDLLADNDERAALSPKVLFGLNKDVLRPILQGLAVDYPTFIRVDFTKGIMDNIFLEKDKTSSDVISLF